MYNWLPVFTEKEPGLFGDRENIADQTRRNWVGLTKHNIANSKALAPQDLPGVLIVDSAPIEQSVPLYPNDASESPSETINIDIKGIAASVPVGTSRRDIETVLGVVVAL